MDIRCVILPPERLPEIIPFLKRLDPRLADDLLADRLAEMHGRGFQCVGIHDGDRLIGIAGLWLLTKYYVGRHLEMDDVVIDQSYRSQGVGERLVAWVEGYAGTLGCQAIELNCYVGNEGGHRFWRRCGFSHLGHHYQKILPAEVAPGTRSQASDPALTIRPATADDASAISAIYNHYVVHSTCTYQEEPETLADRQRWMSEHTGAHVVRVATEADGTVVGWASLSPYHRRSAYRFTVEDSIYLRHDRLGRGLGTRLLTDLIAQARLGGFRNIIGGADAEQAASIALHRRAGFQQVAHLCEVGFKFGRWLDVVYLQLALR